MEQPKLDGLSAKERGHFKGRMDHSKTLWDEVVQASAPPGFALRLIDIAKAKQDVGEEPTMKPDRFNAAHADYTRERHGLKRDFGDYITTQAGHRTRRDVEEAIELCMLYQTEVRSWAHSCHKQAVTLIEKPNETETYNIFLNKSRIANAVVRYLDDLEGEAVDALRRGGSSRRGSLTRPGSSLRQIAEEDEDDSGGEQGVHHLGPPKLRALGKRWAAAQAERWGREGRGY
ncbi:hypothetical protein JCM10450v2_008175 [Rhodotorula kratochvilovae]